MAVASILWYLALSSLLMVGQHFLEKRFSRGFGSRETRQQRGEREARTVGGSH
jgi:polar amino acid transport system permease protein